MTKLFRPNYLVRKLGVLHKYVTKKCIYQEIDYEIFEIIFQDTKGNGKYYKTTYIDKNGSISFYQKGENVVCKEVVKKVMNITIWEEID